MKKRSREAWSDFPSDLLSRIIAAWTLLCAAEASARSRERGSEGVILLGPYVMYEQQIFVYTLRLTSYLEWWHEPKTTELRTSRTWIIHQKIELTDIRTFRTSQTTLASKFEPSAFLPKPNIKRLNLSKCLTKPEPIRIRSTTNP